MSLCVALVFSWCALLVPTRGQNELDMETIQKTLIENRKTMLENKEEMQAMRDEMDDLKHQLAEGKQVRNRMRDRLEALSNEKTKTNTEMQHDMRKLESELHKQKSKVVALEEKVKRIRPDLQEYEPIGFTAHVTQHRQYPVGETILFDDVQTNLGGHYDETTCTFTCPHRGVYQFSVHFNAYKDNYMFTEIVRDGTVLGEAMAYYYPDMHLDSHASALVIVECEAGQEVWARSGFDGSFMYGVTKRSHFTGFLLHLYA